MVVVVVVTTLRMSIIVTGASQKTRLRDLRCCIDGWCENEGWPLTRGHDLKAKAGADADVEETMLPNPT